MNVVLSGIIVGIALSIVFIGPVFFLLLETSINKGWRQAIVLDLGVIFCDLLFIFVFYFSMKDVSAFINQNPILERYIFRIGALVMFIYGLVMLFKKENFKSLRKKKMKEFSSNYLVTFINGFLLNLLNVSVIFFWFGLVSFLSVEYTDTQDFLIFIGVTFATFFAIDLVKIFLANKVKKSFTVRNTIVLRRMMGIVLVAFSMILLARSYGAFDKIENRIDQGLEQTIEKETK